MTESRPGGQPRPFGADELDGVSGLRPDELAADTRLARELEASAARVSVRPSPDFTDRVMAAVAKEPAAAPVRAARIALRHGAFWAFLASVRDAWRVTVSPAFPMAMRAQAMAMVLVVVGLTAGTSVVAAGAFGLLEGDRPTPPPSQTLETPVPTALPTATPTDGTASPEPSDTPEPSDSAEPSPSSLESAEPSDAADPSEPTETDEPAAIDSSTNRSSMSRASSSDHTPRPTDTPTHDGGEPAHPPEPAHSPWPAHSPGPAETPQPPEHHG
jgi:hypothetical protein